MAKKKLTAFEIPTVTAAEQNELTKIVEEATYLTERDKKNALEALKKGHVVWHVRLEEFDIKPLKIFQVLPDGAVDNLYNAETNEWLEHAGGDLDMYEILDTLYHAVSVGKLNSRTWVKTVFKNEESWEWFLEELAGYEQLFRIRDPWWFTLAALAEHENVEEGFSTSEDMAQAIAEHARETNQVF